MPRPLEDLFDTHFHLEDEDEPAAIRERAVAAGVSQLLVAGAPVGAARETLARIDGVPGIYAAVGVHPHEADEWDGNLDFYRELAAHPQVLAIGELGLDYHYDFSDRKQQQEVFAAFLGLATELHLPAIVHCREAYEDCEAILREHFAGQPFVVHCFTGTPEWAERFVDLGACLGYTGIITFKKAENVRAALRVTPPDRLLFETDAPYLAPVPHRGKRNEPAYVPLVVRRAAVELDRDPRELGAISTANARRLFGIDTEASG